MTWGYVCVQFALVTIASIARYIRVIRLSVVTDIAFVKAYEQTLNGLHNR